MFCFSKYIVSTHIQYILYTDAFFFRLAVVFFNDGKEVLVQQKSQETEHTIIGGTCPPLKD